MATTTPTRQCTPVPFTHVRIADAFWHPRMTVNRERTLVAEYRQCKETGRIDAFKLDEAAKTKNHIFWDSDLAKWIEAASYSLASHPDPALEALLDEVVTLVVSAQQTDGYLNTHFTIAEPDKRWANLRDCHELYSAGHLMEAAIAHYQATGKRIMLDCLCRFADYIGTVFGTGADQKRGYCGHEEIELALVKLYHATGEERYLQLCQYFVDERGRQPFYFDAEAEARGEEPTKSYMGRYEYCQAHLPVREQSEVVGHAVRAMYLYSGMADLAGEIGDDALAAACRRLWDDLTLKKMYITGGIGPSKYNEGFTSAYDLPNETAYAETCAAIGLVFWAHRMLQLDCDGRYADVMERALYNGVISGVSQDGEKFFYVNPLASAGAHHRQDWFGCACCPPNIARLLASLGGYAYSQHADGLAVHLYIQGEAALTLPDGTPVTLSVETRYPWEGAVCLQMGLQAAAEFNVRLRIPGWCRQYTLTVNGTPVAATVEQGYAIITRTWQPGDRIALDLAMPIERVVAHPNAVEDAGGVALQRGPLVFCVEDVDHAVPVRHLILPDDALLTARFDPELLGGVMVIEGEALAPELEAWDGTLYRPLADTAQRRVALRAIPYYAWDNRTPGAMTVWLPRK